ncbi:uncharacterized protein LOC116349929 isoform X2 [Contarinia nasturtii]|uniref:uncharacterized protein LOC116349929 isoform X2 n=1 Tax=Contarinia nasturtii TaxID=265458 RepID=UPI0012D3ED3F|nr:uncharacterized protein LOC116349929 isoform X2 [Contarinia nasturtii]
MCASAKIVKNIQIQAHQYIVVLYCCTLFLASNALHTFETPIREALLKPRNFNPHPHHIHDHIPQQGAINLNTIDTDYVANSLYNIDVDNSLAVQHQSNDVNYLLSLHNLPHPYATLKYKYNGNHDNYHAVDINEDSLETQKKQYAFSYKVRDTYSGDDFSHTQQQKNGAVQGTYKVQLPDGRVQVVRYTADDGGYRADVSYLIDKNAVHKADESDYVKYNTEEKPFHKLHINPYNSGIPSHPPPTASSKIFVATAVPPIHHASLSLEQRQSISAHPTYVLSAKKTQISDAIRLVPTENSIDDNSILNGPYSKATHHHHHPVYYENH